MEDISDQECHRILDAAEVAHFSVIDGDKPYVSPISYVRHENQLMMRKTGGKRLDAVRVNPKVCVEVSEVDADTGDWRSVIVTGVASEVRDELGEATAVQLLLEKHRRLEGPVTAWTVPELLPGSAVVPAVSIDEMTGRSSGSGFSRKTRPGRL